MEDAARKGLIMINLVEKIFKLRENHTGVRTEIFGGMTTFFTMSYIVFVQPALLSKCGMDFGAVMAVTCIASAVAIFLMVFKEAHWLIYSQLYL